MKMKPARTLDPCCGSCIADMAGDSGTYEKVGKRGNLQNDQLRLRNKTWVEATNAAGATAYFVGDSLEAIRACLQGVQLAAIKEVSLRDIEKSRMVRYEDLIRALQSDAPATRIARLG